MKKMRKGVMMLYEEAMKVMALIRDAYPNLDVECKRSLFDKDRIIHYLLVIRKAK